MDLTVPPGQELHLCQLATLPNDAAVDATSFSHQYTKGSHHFLLIATDLDAIPADLTGQYDCTSGNEPIMAHARGVLYGAQTPTGTFPLPSGVGFRFAPKQVVILQTHYLNPSANAVPAKVELGIDLAKPGTVHEQAGFMFFYDPFIYVGANAAGATGLTCPVPDDIQIISASTHYHQRGTGMRVWNDAPSEPAGAPFFETHDWDHPEDFHGPREVKAGSKLRFECTYVNPESADVFEGPNAKTSEMCVFGGLYYPKRTTAFENCAGRSIVGAGAVACGGLLECVRGCPGSDFPVGPCSQKCIASGCGGATDALLRFSECVQRECAEGCAAGSCEACSVTMCGESLQSCTTNACSP